MCCHCMCSLARNGCASCYVQVPLTHMVYLLLAMNMLQQLNEDEMQRKYTLNEPVLGSRACEARMNCCTASPAMALYTLLLALHRTYIVVTGTQYTDMFEFLFVDANSCSSEALNQPISLHRHQLGYLMTQYVINDSFT